MHLPTLISDLAIVLAVASVFGFVFLKLKQPIVLGYLLAGLVVGPHTPPFAFVRDIPNIRTWADLGVIFLMFSVGLEFSFGRLVKLGPRIVVTGVLETAFMFFLGVFVSRTLGYSSWEQMFWGGILCISSTTIIVKAISDLNLKGKRFVDSVLGILIVEDLIAILMLVFFNLLAKGEAATAASLISATGKLVLVVGTWALLGTFLVPKIVSRLAWAGGNEMLTLISIALCLVLASISSSFDYSPALGAFMMGSLLSETGQVHRIERLVIPFRDLFIAIFFVTIGMMIDPTAIITHGRDVSVFCAVVIVGKIFAVSIANLIVSESPKNALRSAFTMSQVGEFSFIMVTLGLTTRGFRAEIFPIVVAVSVITTFTTPYCVRLGLSLSTKVENLKAPNLLTRLQLKTGLSNNHRLTSYLRGALLKWMASGIAISTLAFFVEQIIYAHLKKRFFGESDFSLLMLTLWLTLASPLIWGMNTALKMKDLAQVFSSPRTAFVLVFFVRCLTFAWVGMLATIFVSSPTSVAITLFVLIAVTVLSYKTLGSAYKWVETQFLSSVEDTRVNRDPNISHLAPWDAFLSRFEVAPHSVVAGKSLVELSLRESYGVNVVVLQRGKKTIVAPKPEEQLLPYDEVVILGNDENVGAFASLVEEQYTSGPGNELLNYRLEAIVLKNQNPLVGRTLRSAEIREKYNCMVVGLERGSERFMNPASDLILRTGDTILLVGTQEHLQTIISLG